MIAITGANGLLGSFIVRRLLEQKETFVALKRSGSDTSLLEDVKGKIQWRDADILDTVSLEEAFQDVSHVIHAAAMVSFNPRAADEIYSINVQGTRNVVNACIGNGVKKLLHISSVAALGRLKGVNNIDEDHKWTDNPLNSTYGESKYLAELEIFRGHEEGLETCILNPSVILAPANWNKSSAKLFRYVWDEKPFYIESHLNFVDARDVALATYQLLHSSSTGQRFIVNAGTLPLREFFTKTAARFQKRAPRIKLNKTFLRMVAMSETWRAAITRSEPLITRETARLAGTHFLYDNKKIKNQLNFEFKSIDATLDWCCQYYIDKLSSKN